MMGHLIGEDTNDPGRCTEPDHEGRQLACTEGTEFAVDTGFAITIGRNIGHEPMDDKQWAWFKASIEFEIEAILGGTLYVHGNEGQGEWEEEDGTKVSETNAVFTGTVPEAKGWTLEHVSLPQLGYEFKQDAIGLVLGRPVLVKANKTSA